MWDASRVLRVPGTFNVKNLNGEGSLAVIGRRDERGRPLTINEVAERITEYGIEARDDDARPSRAEHSPPGTWAAAASTCAYAARMIAGWATDRPRGGARNPWAYSQAVRLHCARRHGCLTDADYAGGQSSLETRFEHLLATCDPVRQPKKFEEQDIWRYSERRAAQKTDTEVSEELGHHHHHAETVTATDAPAGVPDADQGEGEATTWEPIDLVPWVTGVVDPPKPSVGFARKDGVRFLYPGREHAVLGETESGKSWFACACVAEELRAEHPVVYVHYEEADPRSTIERLQILGVTPDQMTRLLRFVAPATAARPAWLAPLLDPPPTLVVHDGVNEAMATMGADIMAADGAASFRRQLVLPFKRVGAAILSCDHVPKDREGRGRDAYGSVHKGNALDGARLLLENVEPFGRGLRGRSNVFITKDRPGTLRAHGSPTKVAGKTFAGVLVCDASNHPFEEASLVLYSPKERVDDDLTAESLSARNDADAVADAVLSVLAAQPGGAVGSTRELLQAMRGGDVKHRDAVIHSAVDGLVDSGQVAKLPGKNRAMGYRLVPGASRSPEE